ncbi:MAG TPA: hemerythrin domain-containing protein [Actinocrinis sp.]|nr:hemerythrin domain-containing protein [Actinocrinis sp.]
MMGHGGNVIEELAADHRDIRELLERLQAANAAANVRGALVARLSIELSGHTSAEEQYLYPTVREYVPEGAALADGELAAHARIEALLRRLEGASDRGGEFGDLLERLAAEVDAHMRDEEDRVFPALARACSPDALDELGRTVRTAKVTAPTRPHPASPDTPPGNILLDPALGLIDRARDQFTGRGHG